VGFQNSRFRAARRPRHGWKARAQRSWPRRSRLFRITAFLILIGGATAFALDATRPPSSQISAALALRAITVYQKVLSPRLDTWGASCRFSPTCSAYARAVIRDHGIVAGSWLTAVRIVRCGPWTPAGTIDRPPPPKSAAGGAGDPVS
jgi:uncharacterized protein